MLLFNIVFFGFRPRFWRVLGLQDGAKSGTLLAAPAVLNPTAFLLALTYCFACSRGGQELPNSIRNTAKLAPCRLIFRSWASFLALERLSRVCWAFVTHVRLFFRVLGGAGSDVWASRDNFEGSKLLFLVFCRPRRSALRKNCALSLIHI